MIVKNADLLDRAKEVFAETGITISMDGERHLGAVLGSAEFKEQYVKNKVNCWIQDTEQLSNIANNEPQLALSAFTKALCMRWCFVQRTISNISHLFEPLEECIREKLIPAIIGRRVSDLERRLLALPVRFGGIGILNPVETANFEYESSIKITGNLTSIIYHQENTWENYNEERVKETISKVKGEKEKRFLQEFESIKAQVNDEMKTNLDLAREKGSGTWLTALPIQALGYTLNRQEFRDSLCLRYGWKIPNTPFHCACGKKNDVNHALINVYEGWICCDATQPN